MRVRFSVLLTTLLMLPLPMMADTVYTYVGQNFNDVSGPYTTSNHVTGSLTFSSPLGANFAIIHAVPIAFSFSDGVDTISQNSAGVHLVFAEVETDASGAINNWFIVINVGNIFQSPLAETILTRSLSPYANDVGLWKPVDASDYSEGQISGDTSIAGTWTESTVTPSAVPEPGSLLLMGTGVLGLAGALRRRLSA